MPQGELFLWDRSASLPEEVVVELRHLGEGQKGERYPGRECTSHLRESWCEGSLEREVERDREGQTPQNCVDCARDDVVLS